MKRKVILSVVIVLLLFIVLSIPRFGDMQMVPVEKIEQYPQLRQAYSKLCSERDLYTIETEENFYIVTIKNLWGSWQRYILPCYAIKVPDIPTAGSVGITAEMHILSEWSEENFFTDFCRLKMRNYSIRVEPGENTALYPLAEFTHPGLSPVKYLVNAELFSADEAIFCNALPTIYVRYKLSTNLSTQENAQQVTTTFYYQYSLRMLGKRFFDGSYVFAAEHLVNN